MHIISDLLICDGLSHFLPTPVLTEPDIYNLFCSIYILMLCTATSVKVYGLIVHFLKSGNLRRTMCIDRSVYKNK